MIVIDNKYNIGDIVYLVTDSGQSIRIVAGYRVYKEGEVMYQLACGTEVSVHYDFEISAEKTFANV